MHGFWPGVPKVLTISNASVFGIWATATEICASEPHHAPGHQDALPELAARSQKCARLSQLVEPATEDSAARQRWPSGIPSEGAAGPAQSARGCWHRKRGPRTRAFRGCLLAPSQRPESLCQCSCRAFSKVVHSTKRIAPIANSFGYVLRKLYAPTPGPGPFGRLKAKLSCVFGAP